MNNINRIIAYGCSYTAGDEIMDHVALGISFEECNQLKREYLLKNEKSPNHTSKFKKDFNIRWDDPLHRNSSWAGQLAKLMNVSFENRATNGSGLDEQYFKIHHDYAQGLILKDDLVLIGLTSMNRMIDFRSKTTTLISKNIPDDSGSRLLLDIYNDDYIVFHYFKTLDLFNGLRSKMRLLMQPMVDHMLPYQLNRLNVPNTRIFAKDIWKNSISNILLPEDYLRSPIVNGVKNKCAFGHPTLESHTELAEKIYKQIELDKLD